MSCLECLDRPTTHFIDLVKLFQFYFYLFFIIFILFYWLGLTNSLSPSQIIYLQMNQAFTHCSFFLFYFIFTLFFVAVCLALALNDNLGNIKL